LPEEDALGPGQWMQGARKMLTDTNGCSMHRERTCEISLEI